MFVFGHKGAVLHHSEDLDFVFNGPSLNCTKQTGLGTAFRSSHKEMLPGRSGDYLQEPGLKREPHLSGSVALQGRLRLGSGNSSESEISHSFNTFTHF